MNVISSMELTPSHILHAAWRGWWLIVLFGIAGILAGEVYLANARPYFISGFTIVPKESSMDQGMGAQARLLFGGASADRTKFEVLQLIMDSDRLAQGLVD